MFKKILGVVFVGFVTTSVIQPAFAAGQTFCGHYARTSVSQFAFAKKNYCGVPINKNGWYQKFDYPYAWCREVSEKKANEQTKNRYAALGKCFMKRHK